MKEVFLELRPLTPLSSYLECMEIIQSTCAFVQFFTGLNHNRTCRFVDLYASIYQQTFTMQVSQKSSYAKTYRPLFPKIPYFTALSENTGQVSPFLYQQHIGLGLK